MAPLLAPLVAILAEKGFNLISKAIDSGEEKAIEYIEEKTGIKLSEEKVEKLDSESILKLKELEKTNELELMRLH